MTGFCMRATLAINGLSHPWVTAVKKFFLHQCYLLLFSQSTPGIFPNSVMPKPNGWLSNNQSNGVELLRGHVAMIDFHKNNFYHEKCFQKKIKSKQFLSGVPSKLNILFINNTYASDRVFIEGSFTITKLLKTFSKLAFTVTFWG